MLPSATCVAKPRVASVLSHHAGPQDPEPEWEAGWGWRQTRFLGHVWTHSPARPAPGGWGRGLKGGSRAVGASGGPPLFLYLNVNGSTSVPLPRLCFGVPRLKTSSVSPPLSVTLLPKLILKCDSLCTPVLSLTGAVSFGSSLFRLFQILRIYFSFPQSASVAS